MNIIPVDPHSDPRWSDFILRHDSATIFHHPHWIQVIEKSYHYAPRSLALVDDERIVGILPILEVRSCLTGVRGVCLPFSDACAPLLETPDLIEQLIPYCNGLVQQNHWKFLEIRGPVNHPSAFPSSRFKTHIIELNADSDRVLRSFKETRVQQVIAKSIRDGVRVERRQDVSAMREFIRLNALTRKKLGVPLQPETFFWNIYENLIAKNHGFVSLAQHGKDIIAASVFLHFKQSMFDKYNASDAAFLRNRPNHLILWDAIKWGCENGYSRFECGRTDLHHAGLLEFKRGWGPVESDLCYYRVSLGNTPGGARGDVLKKVQPILKKAPLPVLRVLGKLFYRHVG